jgi:putative ABC transport system ATP-binding protein
MTDASVSSPLVSPSPSAGGRWPSDPAGTAPLIQLQSVSKIYRTAAGDFPALIEFQAGFRPGEFVSIVGKSGSGKSTLVNMITGIDHPTSGLVQINGTRIHELSESKMSAWRGRNLGIIFQFFQLLPNLSLLENVMLPMDFCDRYRFTEREGRGRMLLEQVGLGDKADLLPTAVAGGEQQRTAIARALANDPPILIADEPTGNLDTASAENVFDIFGRLVGQGKTIVMVTHDMDLAERTDRILLLSDGHQIDPLVASALAGLPHQRLLWLTRTLERIDLAAGHSHASDSSKAMGMVVVTAGDIRIEEGEDGQGPSPERLTSGDLWLAPEGTNRPVRIRAGGAPAAVLTLSAIDLASWLAESPGDRPMLRDLAARENGNGLPPLRRVSP